MVPQLVAEWRRAEERLYPVVLIDAQRYVRSVTLIRTVADRLRSCETTQQLAEAYPGARDVVTQAADECGAVPEELGDVELIAGAAFQLRYRELLAEERRREVADRIEAGRQRGDDWVVLHESGRQHDPSTQPYERVEMRLDDGRGLRASVDLDPDTYRPVYALDELWFDRHTGALREPEAESSGASFAGHDRWQAAISELRDRPVNAAEAGLARANGS